MSHQPCMVTSGRREGDRRTDRNGWGVGGGGGGGGGEGEGGRQ